MITMASTRGSLKPLLLLATHCRPPPAWSSSSSAAGDLALSRRVFAARYFSDGSNNDNDKDKDSDKANVPDALESFKIRRPGSAEGGTVQRPSLAQRPSFRQRPSFGQRGPGRPGFGFSGGGDGRNQREGQRSNQGIKSRKDRLPDFRSEPSLPGDPLLRTHMIDLFPGFYGDEDDGHDIKRIVEDKEALVDLEDEEPAERLAEMEKLYKETKEYEEKRKRWIENSKAVVRVPVIDEVGRAYGRGGRKTASARVWITPGFGNVTVNRKDFVDYFPRFEDREHILGPMVVTRTCGKFDLQCQVQGGGKTGQAGAIRLGVARALQHWNPEYRPPMKKMGYLTRDPRKVERKKVGLLKARKAPQWNRR
jgi:small subunit ribosomal protein S9